MIQIDGKLGEGGGQILRTSVALSAVTGKPFRICDIRAKRKNPGLQNQHLQGILAGRRVCDAECEGAAMRSMELEFTPGEVESGEYTFDIGTAGSASLVLQTVLPILFRADAESRVAVKGGTHNPWAPPYEFIRDSFLPAIGRMGFNAKVSLVKHGFYPAGGGELRATIEPVSDKDLKPLDMVKRGDGVDTSAKAILSNLPLHIGERERHVLSRELGIGWSEIEIEMVRDPAGPGNAVVVTAECGGHKSVFTGFGQKGKKAEDVAREVCGEYREWLGSGAAVCPHLADQLLIYMALGKGGRFTTSEVTQHFRTNVEVIKLFVEMDVAVKREGEGWEVVVKV